MVFTRGGSETKRTDEPADEGGDTDDDGIADDDADGAAHAARVLGPPADIRPTFGLRAVGEGDPTARPKRSSTVPPRRSPARTEVDLIGKLRRLPRHVGVGPDGVSNELLAALDRFHFDAGAARVMPLLNEFCTLEVNGDLPPWWYAAVTLIKLVAL